MEIFLIILNLVISVWNAFVWGFTRKEFKAMGPRSFKWWLSWSVFVMSALGFFMVYLLTGVAIGVSMEWLTPKEMEWALNLGFVLMYPPLMAAGLTIFIYQWAQTFREGGFLNWGASVWNTYAMINNVSVGAQHYGAALDSVGDMFGSMGGSGGSGVKLDKDGAKAVVVLVIVLAAVILALATTWLIGHYAGKLRKDLTQEEFDTHLATVERR